MGSRKSEIAIMYSATTEAGGGSGFVKLQVVDKVFSLPLVNDSYDSLARLSTPLQPYMKKAGLLASPISCNFMAGIESMTPEVIQIGYKRPKGQVVAAAASVDASLCSGVDSLVEKIPVLKQATPALYNSAKEGVGSFATYVASFTLAHIFLKASDVGLEIADSMLKWTSNDKVESIMMGLRRVRSDVCTVRKEVVVRNGTEKAKVLEESSLTWAVVEMFGLASFYTYFVPEEDAESLGNVKSPKRDQGKVASE